MPQRIGAHQIRLDQIFNVSDLLTSRGLLPRKKYANQIDMLTALNITTQYDDTSIDAAFSLFESNILTLGYISSLSDQASRQQFSFQFEWYVAELLKRQFGAFSYEVGLSLRNMGVLGDYDAIVTNRDLSFLYVECKTGGMSGQLILKAIRRSQYICASACIILYTKNIAARSLKDIVNATTYPNADGSIPLQKVYDATGATIHRWNDCYFVKVTPNIHDDLTLLMRTISFRKHGMSFSEDYSEDDYHAIGIEINDV